MKDRDERLNRELESRVQQRTEALRQTNRTLQSTIDELQRMQEYLVQSEKMAALGNQVAGVAQYRQNALEGAQLILRNLMRADKLMRSFKQVAVDQSTEEKRLRLRASASPGSIACESTPGGGSRFELRIPAA